MGRERNKDAWVCLLIFHVDRGNKPKFGAVRGETKAVAEAGLQLPSPLSDLAYPEAHGAQVPGLPLSTLHPARYAPGPQSAQAQFAPLPLKPLLH